jgi:hypothetical protein
MIISVEICEDTFTLYEIRLNHNLKHSMRNTETEQIFLTLSVLAILCTKYSGALTFLTCNKIINKKYIFMQGTLNFLTQ